MEPFKLKLFSLKVGILKGQLSAKLKLLYLLTSWKARCGDVLNAMATVDLQCLSDCVGLLQLYTPSSLGTVSSGWERGFCHTLRRSISCLCTWGRGEWISRDRKYIKWLQLLQYTSEQHDHRIKLMIKRWPVQYLTVCMLCTEGYLTTCTK